MMKALTTLLVANRGEIAVRIMRTAKTMGMRTVAVYSEADADAMHVREADQSICIGPAPVAESYLQINAILEAADRTGADCIHTPDTAFCLRTKPLHRLVKCAVLSLLGRQTPPLR